MTTQTAITLSNRTLDVLKNFSTINSNILVRPGNVINTISPIKNVMAEATVEENFDTEFGIWDLGKFLGTISLFDNLRHQDYCLFCFYFFLTLKITNIFH